MTFVSMKIADICVTGGTQSRAEIDRAVVAEYAEEIERGAIFPPVVIYYDGATHWLADGFHRYEAFAAAGRDEIQADVRQGTQRDAILHSVGANAAHGLRRTNGDKQRAVRALLADDEWSKWSDREIARRCCVHFNFVSKLRKSVTITPCDSEPSRAYVTKHGTVATMQTAAIGKHAEGPTNVDKVIEGDADSICTNEARSTPEITKDRRALAKLTREALEDEVIGLRADLAEAKADLTAVRDERDKLKASLAEATQGDLGRALGNAQRQRDQLSGRINELLRDMKRMERRLKATEGERNELRSQRENELIPLN